MLSRTRSLDPILPKFSFGTKHLGDAQRRPAKSKGKPVATGTRLLLILDLPLKSTLQEALRKTQPILRSSNLFTVEFPHLPLGIIHSKHLGTHEYSIDEKYYYYS